MPTNPTTSEFTTPALYVVCCDGALTDLKFLKNRPPETPLLKYIELAEMFNSIVT
jgi:hypothetical protein